MEKTLTSNFILSREWVREVYGEIYNEVPFKMNCYKAADGTKNADWKSFQAKQAEKRDVGGVPRCKYKYVGYIMGNNITGLQFGVDGLQVLSCGSENVDQPIMLEFDDIISGEDAAGLQTWQFFGFMLTVK